MRRGWLKTVCVCIVFTVLTATIAFGANTKSMVYQGRLTDTSGRSLTNVNSIRFAIYDSLVGGNELWSETHTGIVLDAQGVFTVELGKDTILTPSIFGSGNVYLQLIVDGIPMDSRQLFGAVPFAYTIDSYVDEPGIASGNSGNANTLFPLTSVGKTFASVSVNAPAAGYVFVTGSANVFIFHNSGIWDNVILKLSTTSGDINTPSFQTRVVRVPSSFPGDATYRFAVPVSLTHIFPVSAGISTFYLNAYESTNTGDDNLVAVKLDAIYIPTSYQSKFEGVIGGSDPGFNTSSGEN